MGREGEGGGKGGVTEEEVVSGEGVGGVGLPYIVTEEEIVSGEGGGERRKVGGVALQSH